MDSLTKRRLSEAELAAIIRKTFGAQAAAIRADELTDGWYNAAYAVRLEDGRAVVIKVAPPAGVRTLRYERGLMASEVEVLRTIAGLGTVPVPEVYAYDASRTLIECEYFVMVFVEGTPYNKLKEEMQAEDVARIDGKIGWYNRLINEVRGERFGYVSAQGHRHRTWGTAFAEMIEWLLADAREAGVELPGGEDAIRRLVSEREALLDAVQEPRLVYWDLWDGNVLVHDGRITGFIDAERAIWGDPLMEYHFGHFSGSKPFRAAYDYDFDSPDVIERRKLYDLYLALVMRVETEYRGFDDGHRQWTVRNLTERLEALSTLLR